MEKVFATRPQDKMPFKICRPPFPSTVELLTAQLPVEVLVAPSSLKKAP